MAGASDYLEDEFLDHALGTGAWTSPAGVWVQLHTADPTDVGTTAVATESTRQSISFGAASGGSATSSATVSWTSVAGSETYSHFSLWDASTAGNCLFTGALNSSVTVTAGDNFDLTSVTVTAD